MKLWFIFISIISMALAWATLRSRQSATKAKSLGQKLKILWQSLLVGIIVYFSLLLAAVTYMATGQ